ncbi:MAG: oligosaccharide flippase family protein, partial [Nanoarchaeota archaeon]|nr:oligosaccharide flippase family protein [Nanoarchaeota archaeon]
MSNKTTEEQVNKGLKLLVKSSFIVFIGLFLSKVLTYVYRIIIARYFGPEVYGLFSLTMMVLGWFVAISSLGLVDGLGRFIALYRGKKEYNKIKYLLSISAIILFFSSIIAAIILFFSAEFISINFFHNSNLIIFLKIFSFLIPILIFSNFLLCILRAFEKIAWHSFILNILQNIMKLVVLVLFIFLGLKTTSIIFSYFLGTL